MKRFVIFNSRNKKLVCDHYITPSGAIIILVHGFTGDRHEEGRFDTFAQTFHGTGFNVITFDFGGSGESDDDSLTIQKETDDLLSIIQYVKSKGYNQIGLLGHSLGGLISLRCYSTDIKAMVLTAPVTAPVLYNWREKYLPDQVRECENKGYITFYKEKGIRKEIIIDKRILEEREEVNQAGLLENVDCPVLIIHGNKDVSVPYTDSVAAIKYLSADSKLEIINEAEHSYNAHLDMFTQLAASWFSVYLDK